MPPAAGSLPTPSALPRELTTSGLCRSPLELVKEPAPTGAPAGAPTRAESRPRISNAADGLVTVADVAACVAAVMDRYPDVLLQDPRAIWLRDQLAAQILEQVAGLRHVDAAPPRPTAPAQYSSAPAIDDGRPLEVLSVEPVGREVAMPPSRLSDASRGEPNATAVPPARETQPPHIGKSAPAASPEPIRESAPSHLPAAEQLPPPPTAYPHAASAADALALRWQALRAQERSAADTVSGAPPADGFTRARRYAPRCRSAD
jgi:hypothetical protein